MKVLVTGATGFVGGALIRRLAHGTPQVAGAAPPSTRVNVAAAVRQASNRLPVGVAQHRVGDLGADTEWGAALADVQIVVHCAARVHVMNDTAVDPLTAFRQVNVEGSVKLACDAARAGVKRFVFVSSIKVNGEGTHTGRVFRADDAPAPMDAYGCSKHEAELALFKIGAQTGMEVVVVRPPLVYGPGVKANFAAMLRWIGRGVPLPLGAIDNRRSLVALENLVDCIVRCMTHPAAAGQVFLVSDGEDVSTSELARRMANALGRPARLIPVPCAWLQWLASVLGKGAVAQRLCGSLQVDIGKTRDQLGWRPPVTLDEGLKNMMERKHS